MRRFETFPVRQAPDTPLFKQVGMKTVLFGAREPKLYQLLFMQENRNAVRFEDVFNELGPYGGGLYRAAKGGIRSDRGGGPGAF